MSFTEYAQNMLPALEKDINECLSLSKIKDDSSLYDMFIYHFGWNSQGSSQGKRIRPLILLLTNQACGGNWETALPAASAIELLHNFSLIHDDIEDKSDYRRGRKTLWKEYTLPLALNAGDSMFSISFIAMQRLTKYHSEETTLKALEVFSQACLNLTKGQHLDISFENKEAITINQYWQMINGKTASLLSTCALLGAVIAESDQARQQAFQQFGLHLGLAFQAQDDILGIWGDPKITGKSAASDLLTRKKSLPVIFGLEQKGAFASLWQQEINADNVELLANTLRQEGAYDYTKDQTAVMTEQAHEYFLKTGVEGDAAHALEELFDSLINRQF